MFQAAAFGRLCVETLSAIHLLLQHLKVAAAFGRLCVETQSEIELNERILAAAFGRLCVETRLNLLSMNSNKQPPSGGCVLKPVFLFCRRQWLEQPPSGGCVLKQQQKDANKALTIGSRLRAAVC